jgi:hypothetical protein
MTLLRQLDIVGQLARITCPTLVCVGDFGGCASTE